MLRISEPEISIERLAAKMKEMSARSAQPGHAPSNGTHALASPPLSNDLQLPRPRTDYDIAPLALQPEFRPRDDNHYHASDLLQYHDRNFIQNAYRAILKRGPDATGFRGFLEGLRSGRLNKIDVLARLRYSSEGRAKRVRVDGLFLPAAVRQSYRIPVLGYLLQLMVALARLPKTMRFHQQFEAHALAQQEQIAERVNLSHEHLARHAREVLDTLSRLTEELTKVRAAIESAAEENERQRLLLSNGQREVQQALANSHRALADSFNAWRYEIAGQRKEEAAEWNQRFAEESARWSQRLAEKSARWDERLTTEIERITQVAHSETEKVRENLRAEIESTLQTSRSEREQVAENLREWTGRLATEIERITQVARSETEQVAKGLRAEIESTLQTSHTHREQVAESLRAEIRHAGRTARGETEQAAERLRAEIEHKEQTAHAEMERALQIASAETEQVVASLKAEIERAFEKQQEVRTELALHGRRVTLLLEEARSQLKSSPHATAQKLETFAAEDAHNLDVFYAGFDEYFRGSRAEIKERLRVYLPFIKEARVDSDSAQVLDLGCGRGEWLELLNEEGVAARGVDTNRTLIEESRRRGLQVEESDLMRALRALEDESLAALTGFHIVEHLPFEMLLKMLDEALRVVRPGGLVIFETPNPENVQVGSCNFYFDPTHRNPLPAPVMRYLLELRGFARVRVLKLNPSDAEPVKGRSDIVKRFNQYFYGPMDYAVIGWRT